MRSGTEGATMHISDPAIDTSAPTRIGPLRPSWSEAAPPTICPAPMPMKKLASVRPIMVAVVDRSTVIAGKAGVYMSVAKGGTAAWTESARSRPSGMMPVEIGEGGPVGGRVARGPDGPAGVAWRSVVSGSSGPRGSSGSGPSASAIVVLRARGGWPSWCRPGPRA